MGTKIYWRYPGNEALANQLGTTANISNHEAIYQAQDTILTAFGEQKVAPGVTRLNLLETQNPSSLSPDLDL